MTLTKDWLKRFAWPETLISGHKLAIAHRGASDYAPENTLKSFKIAADLCAEMWELDVRLSADGVCVVSHDDNLSRVAGSDLSISQSSWAQISAVKLPEGQHVPRLEEVIGLAKKTGCGLYIEIKGQGAGIAAWQLLQEADFRFACLGSFVVEWVGELREKGCEYPLSVLVPVNADPLEYLRGVAVDIVHICWRNASPAPDQLLSDDLLKSLDEYQIVLWDEDRLEVLKGLWDKKVMGICSDRPELLKPYRPDPDQPIDIVCHRGANKIAPENTLAAARICIDQGFQYVELDVRTTSDGELVVIHDPDLERTTNGSGPVIDKTLAQIKALDAGSWFRQGASGARVPTLDQYLELAAGRSGLYVEVKQANAEAVLKVIKAHKMLDKCFFWSADIAVLVGLRQLHPEIALMAPRWVFSSVAVAAKVYGAQIVEFDVEQDDLEEISQCRALGVRAMLYSRRSDWDELASYQKYKPDMVNLDYPDRFKIIASYPLVHRHFQAMAKARDS
ncbi:Glycerophosphoryl diester phosphodiesterase [hydrothermal vent metagenome]|uniref:Glycerophosphoryl diester phosphodiesterase n=1 Tax=hydrothermal vent metagenome TaxID=652676 RepID=A0A3B0U7P1_9ZZZZ